MKHEIKICNDQKVDGWIGKSLLEMHSLIECDLSNFTFSKTNFTHIFYNFYLQTEGQNFEELQCSVAYWVTLLV